MQKKVSFGYQDAGLEAGMSSFMNKARKINEMHLQSGRNAKQSGSEQLSYLKEQIQFLERRQRIETNLARIKAEERRDADKLSSDFRTSSNADKRYQTSIGQIAQAEKKQDIMVELMRSQLEELQSIASGEAKDDGLNILSEVKQFLRDEKGGDLSKYDSGDILKYRLQAEELRKQGLIDPENTKKPKTPSQLMSFMGGMMWDRMLSNMSAFPSARTGMDMITPAFSTAGAVAGAGAGSIAELGTAGQIEFGLMGQRLGEAVGSATGQALVRSLESQDHLQRVSNKITALYGRSGVTMPNLSALGLDQIETSELGLKLSKAGLFGRGQLKGRVRDFASAGRVYGLDDDQMMQAIQLGRMGYSPESMRIMGGRAIQGGIGAGAFKKGDRIMAQQLFSNANQLAQSLASVVGQGDMNQVMATMLNFNKIGGQFGIGDTRSMGNIMSIQQGLSSPTNEYMKAMNFQAIRTMSPGAGLFETLKIQQQGIANPKFLAAAMRQITAMGGGEDFQKYAFAKRFGLEGNLAGAEELWQGRDKIMAGGITSTEIQSMLGKVSSEDTLFAQASALTTKYEKQQALITDAFIINMTEGTKTVAVLFEKEMGAAVKLVSDQMAEVAGRATGGFTDKLSYWYKTGIWPWGDPKQNKVNTKP